MNSDSTYVKLSPFKKICFAFGDMGCNFSWSLTSSFLMIFYTDVFGITAGAVSILMLVSRLWDAINDPMIGMMADKTRTKYGRYRPWLFMCVPMAVFTILTFWAHPAWSDTSKLIYMYITYGALVFFYTAVNIPYTSMTATLTQDSKERGSLSGYRMTFSFLTMILVTYIINYFVPTLGKGDDARGYLLTAIIMTVLIGWPCFAICFFGTKEVVPPQENKKTGSFFEQAKNAMRNKPYTLLLLAFFMVGVTNYGRTAAYAYYFKYVVGQPQMMATYVMALNIPFLFGSFLSPYISNALKNKGRNYAYSAMIFGALLVVNFWVNPLANPVFFWILTVVIGFFNGTQAACVYGMLPDTAEYGELQTGVRNEGFLSAYSSFFNKVGMALSTAGVAAMLEFLHYDNTAAVQSSAVLSGVTGLMFIAPGILSIILGAAFLFYKLDYKTYDDIVARIAARKEQKA